MKNRNGQALVMILVALTIFALALVPVVRAGTASRRAVTTRQRGAEHVVEAHRLAKWAAAHRDLLAVSPDQWNRRLATELAGGDALAGAQATLSIEEDVRGHVHLHRVRLRLTSKDGSAVEVQRTVVR